MGEARTFSAGGTVMHSLVGVGVDVTAVHRVGGLAARHGSRFLNRFLHPVELEQAAARSGPRLDQFLASRCVSAASWL